MKSVRRINFICNACHKYLQHSFASSLLLLVSYSIPSKIVTILPYPLKTLKTPQSHLCFEKRSINWNSATLRGTIQHFFEGMVMEDNKHQCNNGASAPRLLAGIVHIFFPQIRVELVGKRRKANKIYSHCFWQKVCRKYKIVPVIRIFVFDAVEKKRIFNC